MNPVRIHEGRGHSRQDYFCDTVKRNGQPATTDTLPYTYMYTYYSCRGAKINLHTTPRLTVVMPISCLLPCADPGIFVGGGGGGGIRQSDKKALTTLFFGFFFSFVLVLSLFYRSQMVNFKEKYHFSRFRRGPNFSSGGGGATFSRGGVQLLIPYRNPYNL